MTGAEHYGLELGLPTTEALDSRYATIDRMSVSELAALMNEADRTVADRIAEQLPAIVPALEAVAARMQEGGRLIYVGAGTPGRIGILDASESGPTFGVPAGLITGIIAGGPTAVTLPSEGAEDDAGAGAAAVAESDVGPLDSVIGLASSGRTPFVIGAVQEAAARGALTVGLSCNPRTPLSDAVHYPIEVVVGPEFISGSTRLKAGTAQKLVLNMFSTISMIRLGKTYDGLMVDVQATNEKLRARAVRITSAVAGVDEDAARDALEKSNYEVKVAIVQLRMGWSLDEARRALDEAHGRLRDIIEPAP